MAANIQDCPICGEDHPRCGRHNAKGEPCMRWPRDEEKLCRVHGGEAPASKAAGAQRRAAKKLEADARAALGYSLDGKVPDIMAAMEGLAAMRLNMVEALAERVNALTVIGFRSDYGVEQIKAEVQLLDKSIDSAARLLEMVAKHKPDGEAAAAVNLLTSLSDAIKNLELPE